MITAIVVAAGESRRMGHPKMALPWGKTSVLGQVLQALRAAEVDEILVVSGAARAAVERIARTQRVRTVFNAAHASGEMLSSVQTGLRHMHVGAEAALIVLGDQPQMQEGTVRQILDAYRDSRSPLIVPSYERHRGHPWLVGTQYWEELLAMTAPDSPREFLNRHAAEITYIELGTETILGDIDTPDDYLKARP